MDEEWFVIPNELIQRIRNKPRTVKRVYTYLVIGYAVGFLTSSESIFTVMLVLAAHDYVTYRTEKFLRVFSGWGTNLREKCDGYDSLSNIWGMISVLLIAGVNILIATPMIAYGSHSVAYTDTIGLSIFLITIFSVFFILPMTLDILIDISGLGIVMYSTPLFAVVREVLVGVLLFLYGAIGWRTVQIIYKSPEGVFGENPPESLIYMSILSWVVAGFIILLPGIRRVWKFIR